MAYTSVYSGSQIDSAVAQVTTNKNNITTLDSKVSNNITSINTLHNSVANINNSAIPALQSLISEKATTTYVNSIDQRLSQALADEQGQISSLKGNLGLKADTAYVNQEITRLSTTSISSNTAAIEELDSRLDLMEVDINGVESFSNTLSENLQTQVNRINNEISVLQDSLGIQSDAGNTLQAQIDALAESKVSQEELSALNTVVTSQGEAITNIEQDYVTSLSLDNTLTSALNQYTTFETLNSELGNYVLIPTFDTTLALYVTLEVYNKKMQELQGVIDNLVEKVNDLQDQINSLS